MRPKIDGAWFGGITVEGKRYEHDIIIRLSGQVRKRKKRLSKMVHGTSHIISLAEIEDLYREKAGRLIIGTGQQDRAPYMAYAYRTSRMQHPRSSLRSETIAIQ